MAPPNMMDLAIPTVTLRKPLPSTRRRLLVVEDNPDTAELLLALLEDEYDVTIAQSFDEAVGSLDGRGYDLFVFDVNLGPGPTGIDLLGKARQRQRYERVPAIACTAYAGHQGRGEYDLSDFTTYIRKPFEIEELLRTVAALLPR